MSANRPKSLRIIAFCCVIGICIVGWEIFATVRWNVGFDDAAEQRQSLENITHDIEFQGWLEMTIRHGIAETKPHYVTLDEAKGMLRNEGNPYSLFR